MKVKKNLTVETVVHPQRNGIGQTADFFIYSENHKTEGDLKKYLKEHRQEFAARLTDICDDKGNAARR